MNKWRITKYNPIFRNPDGLYIKEDWSTIWEIGKTFNGRKITIEDYLNLENDYANTALDLLSSAGLDRLRVKELSKTFDTIPHLSTPIIEKPIKLIENNWLDVNDIEKVIKMMLREAVHCKLVYPYKFYVHIGWDFYMYIGANLDKTRAENIVTNHSLYLEDSESPYS